MFSKVFIKRPVLSVVWAIVILLVGLISIPNLPVEQYPSISPPQVVVKADYTGANAQVVEETVTSVLERQINGVPGMRYMTSTSSNDGSSVIPVTFRQGYNQDIAAVEVQNRIALAEPQLPEVVQQTGVAVTKRINAIAVSFGLYSDRYDNLFLSNYSDLYILDRIRRIPGVGEILPYGERRYAMRIWLDAKQLAGRKLTPRDVVESLQEQNFQVGIGRIGKPPAVDGQQYQIDLQAMGRLREAQGEMVPIGNLVKITSTTGPQTINHYNLFRSIEINGIAAPGYSSGQAIEAMESLAAEILPKTMGFEWSGISLEEIDSGGQAPLIFGLGLVFVFLVLAAQYNNFVDPLIIILSVPLAILGALLAQSLRGLVNDIYCQVGLVMLIGLASKNAILIVEFANQLRNEGLPITKAVIEASLARFRPILMTALSTMLGIFPMVIATGAGSISRQSLGTTVFGGMVVATFLSLFIVPVLYIIITKIRLYFSKKLLRF